MKSRSAASYMLLLWGRVLFSVQSGSDIFKGEFLFPSEFIYIHACARANSFVHPFGAAAAFCLYTERENHASPSSSSFSRSKRRPSPRASRAFFLRHQCGCSRGPSKCRQNGRLLAHVRLGSTWVSLGRDRMSVFRGCVIHC